MKAEPKIIRFRHFGKLGNENVGVGVVVVGGGGGVERVNEQNIDEINNETFHNIFIDLIDRYDLVKQKQNFSHRTKLRNKLLNNP